MIKLLYNCIHLTRQQSNAQNSPSQASPVSESWLRGIQSGFRKGRGMRDQIANIHGIIGKIKRSRNIYFWLTDYANVFDCESQKTVENS